MSDLVGNEDCWFSHAKAHICTVFGIQKVKIRCCLSKSLFVIMVLSGKCEHHIKRFTLVGEMHILSEKPLNWAN